MQKIYVLSRSHSHDLVLTTAPLVVVMLCKESDASLSYQYFLYFRTIVSKDEHCRLICRHKKCRICVYYRKNSLIELVSPQLSSRIQ